MGRLQEKDLDGGMVQNDIVFSALTESHGAPQPFCKTCDLIHRNPEIDPVTGMEDIQSTQDRTLSLRGRG